MSINTAKRKINRNIRILMFICTLICVVMFVEERYWKNNTENLIIILSAMIGWLIFGYLFFKFFGKISLKSKKGCIIMIIFMNLFALVLYYPAIQYQFNLAKDDEVGYAEETEVNENLITDRKERKIFKKTIKAYKSVWKKQNRFRTTILPILFILAIVGIAYLLKLLEENNEDALMVIGTLFLLAVYLLVVALLGGFGTRLVKETEYSVSVGTGWLDYGEVNVYEGNSTIKEEFHVSIGSLIAAVPLTPVAIMVIFIGVLVFVNINILSLIIPFNGCHSIYLHKKTLVNRAYYLGPTWLNWLMHLINKLFALIFSINLVSKDFWLDGVATDYIYHYLSPKNRKLLEKKLNKIEKKYGYYYYF